MRSIRPGIWLHGLGFLAMAVSTSANGILRDGIGARGLALGGAEVAGPGDPLGAMTGNAARLALLDGPAISLGLTGFSADGSFDSVIVDDSPLRTDNGVTPEFAAAIPLGRSNYTLGLSFVVDSAQVGDWRYEDAPGGVDGRTTYGVQDHYTEFFAMRGALGLGARLSDRWSFGASVGLVYHQVGIDLPFIFQSQRTLLGWKTLLDLETAGYGWNADLGLLFRATDDLSLGLRYRSKTELRSTGSAHGNVSAQLRSLGGLDGVPPDFRYDAEVHTELPQSLTAGLSWRFHERWRLALQVDWIDWSASFDSLRVHLDDGSNAAINGLTGGDSLRDSVPLRWHDRLVYRAGLECDLTDEWTLRLGYSYGRSPLPENLVTPVNAAVAEHAISAGVGYRRGPFQFDLGYQYQLPNPISVGASGYRSGEYSRSSVRLETHAVALTATYSF